MGGRVQGSDQVHLLAPRSGDRIGDRRSQMGDGVLGATNRCTIAVTHGRFHEAVGALVHFQSVAPFRFMVPRRVHLPDVAAVTSTPFNLSLASVGQCHRATDRGRGPTRTGLAPVPERRCEILDGAGRKRMRSKGNQTLTRQPTTARSRDTAIGRVEAAPESPQSTAQKPEMEAS